jgi:catechol 2,3-dioxygenase
LGVLRLSHLELRVVDLELAAAYYTEVVGMVEVARDDGHVYLKCWDEADHHSLALAGHTGPGLQHIAFRVDCPGDLDDVETAAARLGCPVRRLPAGEEAGQGEGLRIAAPSGHEIEIVHDVARTGSLLPRVNPPPEPPGLLGIHPPRLDHVQVTAEEVTEAAAFFTDVLGFRLSERLVAAGGSLMGAWLERSHTAQDVGITRGANGGLHHFGFWVDDWDQLRRAADVLAANGVQIETGPTRHGIGRSLSTHFFDPFGNRNEVFTGGYRRDPDDEPVTWTEEEIGRAFFHYRGQLDARFLAARR